MSNPRYGYSKNSSAEAFDFPSLDERHTQVTVAFGFKEVLSLFYIGEDRTVHQAAFSDGHWEDPTVKKGSVWPPPLADKASADISVAYDYRSNRMWLYYMSNGSLTQAYKPEQDIWHAAVALPTVGPANETDRRGGPGLSSGAKIGMGIGVGLGAALLLTAIAVYIFVHLRRSRQKSEGKAVTDQGENAGVTTQSPPSHPGSPAPRYTSGQWSPDAHGTPGSQSAFPSGNKPEIGWAQDPGHSGHQSPKPDPIFEMLHTNAPQEMMGTEVQSSPVSPSSAAR